MISNTGDLELLEGFGSFKVNGNVRAKRNLPSE